MSNLETFNVGVGLIFNRLLQQFPIEERVLDLRKLDPDADAQSIAIYCSTMEFLAREGFVNARPISSNAPWYGNVSLTMKSLTLLQSTPESLKEHPTWGERFGAAAKTGAREGIAVVTRGFLEYVGTQFGLPRRAE